MNIFLDFSNYSFSLWSIPPLFVSVYFIVMGIFVLLRNLKSKVNITFFFFCFGIFWWQFSWFILFNTHNDYIASILVKIGYSGITFLGVLLLHFVIECFEFKKMKPYLYFCYVVPPLRIKDRRHFLPLI